MVLGQKFGGFVQGAMNGNRRQTIELTIIRTVQFVIIKTAVIIQEEQMLPLIF